MKVLIIGTGSIGIAIACSLISQNVDVSLFSREATAKVIKDEGIAFKRKNNTIKCSPHEFKIFTKYDDLERNCFDYIFISSKTTGNDEISKNLSENKDILKENGKIIIFQNGFGNDEPYLRFFKSDEVYCARVITGLMRSKRNISQSTLDSTSILLGSLQDAPLDDLKELTFYFKNTGFESDITTTVSKDLWAKMLYNCALNPLGAILNVKTGQLTENEYSKSIVDSIIDEVFKVMDAYGYTTFWENSADYKEVFYSELVPDTYDHLSSTSQDILNKNKTEIDSFSGKIVELAHEKNIPVPTNEMIYKLIKSIESEF